MYDSSDPVSRIVKLMDKSSKWCGLQPASQQEAPNISPCRSSAAVRLPSKLPWSRV